MRQDLRARALAVSIAFASSLLVGAAPRTVTQAAEGASMDSPTSSFSERAEYGLPTDSAALERLADGKDVGTSQWGVPMTEKEAAAVDLDARMEFADAVDRDVLPDLRALSSFGGAWIDQLHGGGLVVQLTRAEIAATEEAFARLPTASRGLAVEFVAHSETELLAALVESSELWTKTTRVMPLSMAVDTRGNGLVVNVLAQDRLEAGQVAATIAMAVGIPIVVDATAAARPSDVSCTDREHCSDPYEAGVLIREGSITGSPFCTMAFPIVVGGDVQVVTAGHCGHYGTTWYHKGEGKVGSVQDNQWEPEGKDILRLSMFDVQASENVYGFTSAPSWGPEQYNAINGYPISGETLCVSLGKSNRSDCGTVTSTNIRYWSDTTGFWVWGAKMNGLTPIPIDGDSGSPVHRSYQYTGPGTPHWRHTAVGVLTTEFGEFAKINTSLAVWNATIWTG